MFHFYIKNNFLKISPKEYHIFRGNYAYQPDWKEKNALPSSYKKFYIAVHIGFLSLSLNYVTVALVNDGIINFFFC